MHDCSCCWGSSGDISPPTERSISYATKRSPALRAERIAAAVALLERGLKRPD